MTAHAVHLSTGWHRWWISCPPCDVWEPGKSKQDTERRAAEHNADVHAQAVAR